MWSKRPHQEDRGQKSDCQNFKASPLATDLISEDNEGDLYTPNLGKWGDGGEARPAKRDRRREAEAAAAEGCGGFARCPVGCTEDRG